MCQPGTVDYYMHHNGLSREDAEALERAKRGGAPDTASAPETGTRVKARLTTVTTVEEAA